MDGHKSLTRYSKIPKRPLPSQLRNYLMFRLLIPILVISQRNILPEISLMEFWRNIAGIYLAWHFIKNVLKQSGKKNILPSHVIEVCHRNIAEIFLTHTRSKVFWCNIAELFWPTLDWKYLAVDAILRRNILPELSLKVFQRDMENKYFEKILPDIL